MDTKSFKNLTDEAYKQESVKNWTAAPCGSNYVDGGIDRYTKEYFDEIEASRYTIQPWLKENLLALQLKDKNVLEIGFGMGTDHLMMARLGAVMHGIDITPGNREITNRRFEIYQYQTELTTGDAETLPYSSDSMDFVYSFGVLHHTPNMEKAINEVYRVLKPGGECYIAVYNKNSIFYKWSICINEWLMGRQYKKYTLKQRLSLIEYPNDNPNLVVKLHTKSDLKRIFKKFAPVKIEINHLTRDCIIKGNRLFSDKMIQRLSTRFGWYLIVKANKPMNCG